MDRAGEGSDASARTFGWWDRRHVDATTHILRSIEVAVLAKKVVFPLAQGEDVVHGTTEESGMRFVTLRETGRAAVPETSVEFVDGLGRRIEPVDGVTSVGQRSHLTPVVRMSNGRGDEMGFPGQPFEGRWRLVDT